MRREHQPNIHLLLHGEEAGGITKADIERRARELALIRGGREDYTEDDLQSAARELLGGQSPAATTEDDSADAELSRDPSEPRSVGGMMIAHDASEPEENAEPERLALQGVDEAQHDQMVEARKRDRSGEDEPT